MRANIATPLLFGGFLKVKQNDEFARDRSDVSIPAGVSSLLSLMHRFARDGKAIFPERKIGSRCWHYRLGGI
jgi:hypothetical protein